LHDMQLCDMQISYLDNIITHNLKYTLIYIDAMIKVQV